MLRNLHHCGWGRYYYSYVQQWLYDKDNVVLFNVICTFLTLFVCVCGVCLRWCVSVAHMATISTQYFDPRWTNTRWSMVGVCAFCLNEHQQRVAARWPQKGCETWKAQYCGLIKLHLYMFYSYCVVGWIWWGELFWFWVNWNIKKLFTSLVLGRCVCVCSVSSFVELSWNPSTEDCKTSTKG